MKQYYAYIDGQQIGPTTIEELKLLNIQPSTLVWTVGLPDWVEAKNIEEFKSYFVTVNIPPPISNTPIPPPIHKNEKNKNVLNWFKNQSNLTRYGIVGGGLCFVLILWSSLYSVNNSSSRTSIDSDYVMIDTAKARKLEEEKRQREIEIEEKAHEKLLEIKQNEEKQKNKEELKRLWQENQRLEAEIRNLENVMDRARENLSNADRELSNVREFQFGRLRSEREAQENRVLRKIARIQQEYYISEAKKKEKEDRIKQITANISKLEMRIQNNITY